MEYQALKNYREEGEIHRWIGHQELPAIDISIYFLQISQPHATFSLCFHLVFLMAD